MSQPARTGFWRSLRELPGRTPLRVKLMTAVLALVAIALAVISVAGIQILKPNLLSPYDSTLETTIGQADNAIGRYLQAGVTGEQQGVAVGWIPQGGKIHQVIQPVRITHLGLGGPSGPPVPPPAVSSDPSWIAAHLNQPFTLHARSGGTQWRVLMQTVEQSNGSAAGTVVYAIDASSVYTTVGKLATIDLLVSLAVMALIGILGVGLIRASLRALTDVEKTAGAIAAGDLSRRVPERDPRTEMGRLGRSLNAMLSQIESAFRARSQSEAAARRSEERMRQFVADASHELRTPLTAIRGFAEYYRQRGGVAAGGAAGGVAAGGVAAGGGAAAAAGGRAAGSGAAAGEAPGGRAIAGAAAPDAAPADGGSDRRAELTPPDMDRIMRRVEQESARMGFLVEDMLLLARLDQQRPLTARPVDLLTLAADAVHDARVVAPARSINLTVGAGTALLVIGDEVRLRQVTGNLMSNALTHTPDGTPIDVLVRAGNLNEAADATAVARPDIAGAVSLDGGAESDDGEAESDDGAAGYNGSSANGERRWDAEHVPPPPGSAAPSRPGEVRAERVPAGPAAVLEVTDHGPGLTSEQARHVFERFYRADPARTTGGTGLGLAIVAALVAAHGGACWVRSRPGQGATFCIALPLSPDAVQGPEADFEDDAGDVVTETGNLEAGNPETGNPAAGNPAAGNPETGGAERGATDNGAAGNGTTESRGTPVRPTPSSPAYTAGGRAELGS